MIAKWAKKNHVPQTVLDEWVNVVLAKVKSKATKLSQWFGFPEAQSIFHDKGVKKCLQNVHERFVVTTADKAGNNIVFICKKIYHERAPGGPNTGNSTYKVCPKSINDVVKSHVELYKGFNMTVPDKFKCLPYFNWLLKLHKTPYGSRFIAASSRCTTTLVSKILTVCLGLVRKRQQVYYEAIYRNSGIKGIG